MLFSSHLRRFTIVLGLGASLLVAGCSGLTPVYGERGLGAERVALSYAAPASRLDQVVYQALALRFGPDAGPDAPQLAVSTTIGTSKLTRTPSPNPQTTNQVTVSARAVITDPTGAVPPIVLVRSGTALFTTASQSLANNSAADEAAERAARTAAEALRLAILAELLG